MAAPEAVEDMKKGFAQREYDLRDERRKAGSAAAKIAKLKKTRDSAKVGYQASVADWTAD